MAGTSTHLIKREIRARIRRERLAVPSVQARRAAAAVSRRLWSLPGLARATRIAFYLPMTGELDAMPAIAEAWHRHRRVYLPVLSGSRLRFADFGPRSSLVPNRYGIPEPDCGPRDWLSARELDVVVAPLVAFDEEGRRLGMGGGFYDRTLAFLMHASGRRPRFIGIAYDFQKVARLPEARWDVCMDIVVSEVTTYRASC